MNDITVEMREDMLVISGSKERKRTTGEGEQQRSERVVTGFQRLLGQCDATLQVLMLVCHVYLNYACRPPI